MKLKHLGLLLLPLTLAACQTTPAKLKLPAPIPAPQAQRALTASNGHIQPKLGLTVGATPKVEVPTEAVNAVELTGQEPKLSGPPINASIESMALPAFINEVYANILHLNFQVDPAVAKLTDLVTLRVPKKTSPQDFYRLIATVLRSYGLATHWTGTLVQIEPVRATIGSEPPLIISGRALPSVPQSHRPIFQMVDLKYVRASDVVNWLKVAYKINGLTIESDVNRNSVVLYGKPSVVIQAAQAIAVLDRPYLRGHYSVRLTPAFMSARDLAAHLTEILNAEGYAASNVISPNTSVLVIPINSVNAVIVFAPSESILNHVIEWAHTIDKPAPTSGTNDFFYYQVENTRAADIADVLQGQSSSRAGPGAAPMAPAPGAAAAPQTSTSVGLGGIGQIVVDASRNGLIFRGSADEWARLLPLIKEMDKPARQVMVEVTIAEVTLDRNDQFGVNWQAGKWTVGTLGSSTPTTGTTGTTPTSTTSGGGGLTYLLDVAGQNRAQLQALAASSRVSILSTPRILVTSGSDASIDVGTQVPIITSQTTASQTTLGTSNLLQSVEYRNTGVLLTVKPTVLSNNRVDLDISQEDSQAQPISSGSGVNSPSIFQRKIKTTLTLRDGGSVVLGGLVSNQTTTGNSGVPFLKDIPIFGNLFKSSSRDHQRTELVVIIVPYIIENSDQAEQITQDITKNLSLIDSTSLKSGGKTQTGEVDGKDPGGQQ
jgi:general secretion pathway protein D